MVAALDDPRIGYAVAVVPQLVALADAWGTEAGALAIAHALHRPAVATALLGATSAEQGTRNVKAVRLASTLDAAQLAALAALAA